jgi:L-serine dehydratase
MRAARMFTLALAEQGVMTSVTRVLSEMFGSLGATGKGHGTDTAVLLGLSGHEPDTVDVDQVPAILGGIRGSRSLLLQGEHRIALDEEVDLMLCGLQTLAFHSNGMRFTAFDASGSKLVEKTYYSVGGGFVLSSEEAEKGASPMAIAPGGTNLPFQFHSAVELLRLTREQNCSIAQLMWHNERHWRTEPEIRRGLLNVWQVMQACVERGCRSDGILPGKLKVRRRAPALAHRLQAAQGSQDDPLAVLDWVNLYALAVNEENAAGGRVVTAPTNGAAGIVPAVLHYYTRFVESASEQGVMDFLLTAGAIALLYKENASISGAEVGCQGEVGVACSMAAAGLCAVMGGSPEQVENAAEIGMEHHLGLTCDPVGGLVQIPCIERNALASVKAINAARMALNGDGHHHVSLDQVIKTMRETGADMMTKYKETSRGGLAVNIIEC